MIPFTKLTEEQLQKYMLHGSGALAQGYNELVDAYEQQQKRISELEWQNNLMHVIVNCVKPHPKNPDGVSIEDADGYEWLQVIRELNKPPKEQDDEL